MLAVLVKFLIVYECNSIVILLHIILFVIISIEYVQSKNKNKVKYKNEFIHRIDFQLCSVTGE